MVEAVVVEDSPFMRVQIREILEAGGISVVDEAHNGKAGIESVQNHQPDVVTMDLQMPGVDGIEAVERIMATTPTPILMLSRFTADGNDVTFEALEAGAVDFFAKPDGDTSTTLVQYADELVETVEAVAQADISATDSQQVPMGSGSPIDDSTSETTDLRAETWTPETPPTPDISPPDFREQPETALPTLVVVASTGGPTVVQDILEFLPTGIGLRVVVVQHMPQQFTERYADRLDQLSSYEVREATQETLLGPDEAVIAKGGYHLIASDDDGTTLELALTKEPPVHSVRPAADLTLKSVAETVGGPLVAVVLTGMGYDGAIGMEHVAVNDGSTIVQSPADADIESMPENAIETGVIDTVVPSEDIPRTILETLDQD